MTKREIISEQSLAITNILGDTEPMPSPGYATFTWHGREARLEALSRNGRGLWFSFRDLTSDDSTYAACRFLDAELPQDGRVTLDFNQAFSPPCAFTTFATCPLPPQNRLSVRIEAGEQYEHY